jgi:hypothetical protein
MHTDVSTLLQRSRGARSLVPGSIRRYESIAAVRFLVAVVVVDLIWRFRFAKTRVVEFSDDGNQPSSVCGRSHVLLPTTSLRTF